ASDSVDGQRSRPSAVTRFDLLKVVGSRPARRASPEGDSPARSASRSSAAQTWPWVSIRGVFGCLAMRKSGAGSGNYCRNRLFPHLYGELDLGAVTAILDLRARSDGYHDVPELIS